MNALIKKIFRSSKYSLTLSSTSIEILKQYLVRHSHIILLQMINCWFDFEEKKTQDTNVIESEENEVINQVCKYLYKFILLIT